MDSASVQADILPGWTMYFFDFDRGQDLELKVTQRNQLGEDLGNCGENGDEMCGEPDAPATGVGHFDVGGICGSLFVTRASWHEWNETQGFPEHAFVKGKARLGLFKWRTFKLKLISNYFPGLDQRKLYDEALLEISGNKYRFKGQLHHGRIRAWFAPPGPSLTSRKPLATTWGEMKK
jgi:hypothetical protein